MINSSLKIKYFIECPDCYGTKYAIGPGIKKKDAIRKLCRTCKGRGKLLELRDCIVTTDNNGQNIAFDVDGAK